jgi:hypothetical protein
VAITLDEPWAKRRFAICFRGKDSLQPASARLLDFLQSRVGTVAPATATRRRRRTK